ncbi:MAG: hypothetical protein JW384_00819 [Nitrosomonadaceae bacterium]|nr:hypothetical protein [Nitrosomonadaceae bacterium]
MADIDVQVAADAGDGEENILTTFMVVNAAVLLEATGNKIKEFRALVKRTEPKPHVIVVHEVNGFSGEARVRDVLLHGALAIYDAVYSQKLKLSETGARAGGGIMCLFKRELFKATNVHPPRGLDTSLLDGHVRTWCLWRKKHPSVLPLIVTVAYIPPEDKKNSAMRRQGLHVVPALVEHVKKMWSGSQHVVVAHVNAPDGCQVLRTKLKEVLPTAQVAMLPPFVDQPVFTGCPGMCFSRTSNGEVIHQRMRIKSIGKATLPGKKFAKEMALQGMLPMMGVSGKIHPSTRSRCTKCDGMRRNGVCNCKRSRLSGQNDIVFIEQEALWQGLRSGLAKSELRSDWWSSSIDHSVLRVTVPLVTAGPSQPSMLRVWSEVRRLRLAKRLELRANMIQLIGIQTDEALVDDPGLTASGAWRKIGEAFYEPTMDKTVMTPEELSAAAVNAPKLLWDFQKILRKEAGSAEAVSSAGLLDCICNNDGSLLEGDPQKTALLILQHRQAMATIPARLCCGEEVVYDAIRSVSMHNRTVVGLDVESAAYKTSVRPGYFWEAYDGRRNISDRDGGGYVAWRRATPGWDNQANRAYEAVQVMYPGADEILNAPISMAEVTAMLARMKDVGASLDNVPPVVMQAHASHTECAVIQALTLQFNEIFRSGVVPEEWQRHRMLLVHKGHGAHQSALDSYRAIGIGCCDLKMLSLIMEERLNTFLEVTKSLSHNQMGFKRRSGTREATLALSEIIKQASRERPVLTAFIDVKAAYDSVIREVLYAKMLKMGIGGRFLTTIQGLFHSMEAELEVGGAMIGLVKMELGLAQGSPLSPVLFNIYINSCITELERLAHAKAAEMGGGPIWTPSAGGCG